MEFITEEIKTQLGLTDEQVNGIKPLYETDIATKQKDWDGKANENAEKIIEGVIKTTQEKFKITLDRNQGEKLADYLDRLSGVAFSTVKTELETAKTEYANKLKDFKGDEATKEELRLAKEELDKAKQKYADYDELKSKADRVEPLETEYKNMKTQIAFQGVKPTFPDTVDEYRSAAKWGEFVKSVEEKYTIEIVEGVAICKDKENEYVTKKLKDLVAESEEITQLMQGRKQQGSGAGQGEKIKVEGVPFEIPKDPTVEKRSELIKEHLMKEGIDPASKDYSTKFKELNDKIRNAK